MTKEHEEIYKRLLEHRTHRVDVRKAALRAELEATDRELDAYDCGLIAAIREIERADAAEAKCTDSHGGGAASE